MCEAGLSTTEFKGKADV